MTEPAAPGLEFVAAMPFSSGTVSGPGLAGRVLPGAADVQLVRAEGVAESDAKYLIETDAPELHELRWFKVS
jgi:hypothetical protein